MTHRELKYGADTQRSRTLVASSAAALILLLTGGLLLYLTRGRALERRALFLLLLLCAALALLALWQMGRVLSGHARLVASLDQLASGGEGDSAVALAEASENDLVSRLLRSCAERLSSRYLSIVAEDNGMILGLRSQMDPHFLYNSLDSIRGQALAEGSEEIANVIEALEIMTLDTFQSKEQFRSLEAELRSVRNYLEIQKFRVGDVIEYEEAVDGQDNFLMAYRLPTLTLQPIVENSVNHGLDSYSRGGRVTIRAAATGSSVMILVEDNGTGISEEELREINLKLSQDISAPINRQNKRAGGIALLNINARIKYYYGPEYGIDIRSIEGYGTTVEIRLPAGGIRHVPEKE